MSLNLLKVVNRDIKPWSKIFQLNITDGCCLLRKTGLVTSVFLDLMLFRFQMT